MLVRLTGVHLSPGVALVIDGAGVVSASFLLAWAAEAAQLDVAGGLAIAVLAVIAVLPEYFVDLYYAFAAGHVPAYLQFASANMTGSNRLLMGLGWPAVVLVAAVVARRSGVGSAPLALPPGSRVQLGFLLIAGIIALAVPVSGQIHIGLGVALLVWFGCYLYTMGRGEVAEPQLIGTAAALAALPRRARRLVVTALFAAAGTVILLCAAPFADNLIAAGMQLGADRFLLVQWVAPVASEAPEFIVAILLAARGRGAGAIAMLISAKVNQWTLLVGSLPLSYLIGGGGPTLRLDARQVDEVLLTATQTLMGVALILALRFHRYAAAALLGLFVAQFPLGSIHDRLVLSGSYAALAIAGLIAHRRHLWATVAAPFAAPRRRLARGHVGSPTPSGR
ncbi:MAG: sodium:proton exchanger [Mycobacterium sp.]|uniref:sodium:proton exchanger n=1 Tax=Mycobacterium sp. TaxID=1785 RepID=UPI0026061D3B|nr:sodium:proton exchanger [Mycobacterium sp.]MDI3314227.1 sodium:proton exchanger [Mycobacterium sp.]